MCLTSPKALVSCGLQSCQCFRRPPHRAAGSNVGCSCSHPFHLLNRRRALVRSRTDQTSRRYFPPFRANTGSCLSPLTHAGESHVTTRKQAKVWKSPSKCEGPGKQPGHRGMRTIITTMIMLNAPSFGLRERCGTPTPLLCGAGGCSCNGSLRYPPPAPLGIGYIGLALLSVLVQLHALLKAAG